MNATVAHRSVSPPPPSSYSRANGTHTLRSGTRLFGAGDPSLLRQQHTGASLSSYVCCLYRLGPDGCSEQELTAPIARTHAQLRLYIPLGQVHLSPERPGSCPRVWSASPHPPSSVSIHPWTRTPRLRSPQPRDSA